MYYDSERLHRVAKFRQVKILLRDCVYVIGHYEGQRFSIYQGLKVYRN